MESFMQHYGDLHQELEKERHEKDALTIELSQCKQALQDACKQVSLLKERALDAEQALSDLGFTIDEANAKSSEFCSDRDRILEKFRDLQGELESERRNYQELQYECQEKICQLQEEIDNLRRELEVLLKDKQLSEETKQSLQDFNDALQALLESYSCLFPQSSSSSDFQFRLSSGTPGPSFMMLVSTTYKDLIENVHSMCQVVPGVEELVKQVVSFGVETELCQYMRQVQVAWTEYFGDVEDATQKQMELTKYKINYENDKLDKSRESFICALLVVREKRV